MLAINHVTLGLVVATSYYVYTAQPLYFPLLIYTVIASLLPDIDHKNSSISKLIPWIHLVFGHRGFTHSIAACIVFAALVVWLFDSSVYAIYAASLSAIVGAIYIRTLLSRRIAQLDNVTLGFFSKKQLRIFLEVSTLLAIACSVLSALVGDSAEYTTQIITMLLIGYASHLVGDLVTKDGIPLLWPSKQRFGLSLFKTGSVVEMIIGIVLTAVFAYQLFLLSQIIPLNTLEYWIEPLRV